MSLDKEIKINGLETSYRTVGNGKIKIVLLHGWGVPSDKYLDLARYLLHFSDSDSQLKPTTHSRRNSTADLRFSVIIPDLPGFGRSEEPKENWKLDDYVEFVDKFIGNVGRKKKGFESVKSLLLERMQKNFAAVEGEWNKKEQYKQYGNVHYCTEGETASRSRIILIGHSFGGRIAIKYAARHPEKIEKLILTGAAGIKHSLTVRQRIFFSGVKIGKVVFSLPVLSRFQKYAREVLGEIAKEKDYYKASPRMKEIMKNILAEDLTPVLEKIKVPTLLVWGKLDRSTPLSDGKLMKEKIKNSELVVVDDANHSLPYQKSKRFAEIVLEFVKS